MTEITDALREGKRLRLLATALELLQHERIDSAVIEIPGTDPQRYVVIGTAETIGKLLKDDEQPVGYLASEQIAAGAAVKYDHGQPIGRNVAIDVFDAMKPAAGQEGGIA